MVAPFREGRLAPVAAGETIWTTFRPGAPSWELLCRLAVLVGGHAVRRRGSWFTMLDAKLTFHSSRTLSENGVTHYVGMAAVDWFLSEVVARSNLEYGPLR
ncbi:hypothetical protein MTO96_020696 [Rhipicephalus appendiculatus]